MTNHSLSKTIVDNQETPKNTKKGFLLNKEFSILNELEIRPPKELIKSSELVDLGMLMDNGPLSYQIAAWDIPIKKSFKVGYGQTFLFEREAVIGRLGNSYLVPFSFLREHFEIHHIGRQASLWAKKQGLKISKVGGTAFVIRAEVVNLINAPVCIRGSDLMAKKFPDPKIATPLTSAPDLLSPPPAVPDGDPVNHSHGVCLDHRHEPIIQTDNPVAPQQLPVMDITPRGAPLVTTLDEVNLALLKQIRDMLERCESLMKDADNSYELMIKQNRHIFKATEKINSNLETLVKEFA